MDQVHDFDYKGMTFLCSAEDSPAGGYCAAVRYRAPPDQLLRTIKFGDRLYDRPEDALTAAEELAKQWADNRGGKATATD